MGKIKQGILGGFSGKVGSVVGGSWKGISYMRGKAVSIKNPQTLKQMKQRTKFALALSILQPIAAFIRIGFKRYARKKSEFNAAMSYTVKHAIVGTYPDYEINFLEMLVSRGRLPGARNADAQSLSGRIRVTWSDNSGTGEAKPTDKVMILVINLDNKEVTYITDGPPRSAGMAEIPVSPFWVGTEVGIYVTFITEDGKEVATSTYCGSQPII